MVKSKFTAPHYTFVEEVDATALIALRNRLNESLAKENVKLSFLPVLREGGGGGVPQVPAGQRQHGRGRAGSDRPR